MAGCALVACGAAKPAGEGAPCQLVADCLAGLVCVPQRDGTRVCSANLDPVVRVPGYLRPREPEPEEDASADASEEGGSGEDGAPPGDGGSPTDGASD